MGMWLWTLERLQRSTDADGDRLYQSARQGVTFPLADALCWLLAARCQILDAIELEERGAGDPAVAEGLPGLVNFMTDLCHVQSARASGEVARICAELVFGYNRHPAWDEAGYRGCYQQDELDSLEGIIPGIGSYGSGCHRKRWLAPQESWSLREVQWSRASFSRSKRSSPLASQDAGYPKTGPPRQFRSS